MEYPTTFPEGCDPAYSHNHTNNILRAYTWFYTRAEIRIFTYGLPLVLIIGLLGNGSFLFVVAKLKRLHNNTNIYLASLAAADIAYVLVSVVTYMDAFYASPVRYDAPYNNAIGCALSFGFAYAMYYTSIGVVTLVTHERYYGICLPLQHRAIASRSRTKTLISITYTVGLILGFIRSLKFSKLERFCIIWPQLPDFTGWPQKVEFCVAINDNVLLLDELIDTIPFFVALLWNGYMYARIMYSLSHRASLKMEDQEGNVEKPAKSQLQLQAIQIRHQVARVLIINGSLFFFCQIWARFNAIHNILKNTLGVKLFPTASMFGFMLVFGRCMLYVNSSLNPFIYNLTSSYYRDAYKEAFCGGKICDRSRMKKTSPPRVVARLADESSQHQVNTSI